MLLKYFSILKGVDRELKSFNILKESHNPFLINLINEGQGTIIRNEIRF